MATLSNEELITRASVPVVKSSGDPVAKAKNNGSLINKNKIIKRRDPDKEYQDKYAGSELKTKYYLLKPEVWAGLSRADKCIVLDIVNDIEYLDGMKSLQVGSLNAEKQTVIDKLEDFLKQASTHIQTLDSYKTFGHKSIEDLLGEMDKGLAGGSSSVVVPSEEDLQIATILKMAGFDVQFDGSKWKFESEVSPVVSYAREIKNPVFSKENIDRLVSYLNYEDREGIRVVPSKLMQVYRDEFAKRVDVGKDAKAEEKTLTERVVAEENKVFTMDSNEYIITRLTDTDTILRNAQRMALVSSFESAFSKAPKTSKFTNELTTDLNAFSTSKVYGSRIRHLRQLVNAVDRTGSKFGNMGSQGGYNPNYLEQYNEQIRRLKAKDPNSPYLAQLEKAKEIFVKTLAIQNVFFEAKIEDMLKQGGENGISDARVLQEELKKAIVESMGFTMGENNMVSDNVLKFFEERGNSGTFEELKAMLGKGGSTQEIEKYLREKKLVPEAENAPKAGSVTGQP